MVPYNKPEEPPVLLHPQNDKGGKDKKRVETPTVDNKKKYDLPGDPRSHILLCIAV